MKIVILMAIWQRPEVLRLVLDSFKVQKIDFDLKFVFVVSPEDPFIDEIMDILNEFVPQDDILHFVESKNLGLGKKHNEGVKYAFENLEFDYLMNTGSDDVINLKELLKGYSDYINSGAKLIGYTGCYISEFGKDEVFSVISSNPRRTVGAGRLIHYSVIEKIMRMNKFLYHPHLNRGLDGNSADNILRYARVRPKVINDIAPIIDVKSEVNINSYEKFGNISEKQEFTFKQFIKKLK